MRTLHVATGNRPYDIFIERGLIKDCGNLIKGITNAQRVMVISDSNVFPIYGETVCNSLKNQGFEVFSYVFEAGEERKNLNTIYEAYDKLADNGFTRKDIIVALGGGVTGDMAGYAAATFLRGIDFIQIPTSLLAQVDSSVGGKTGVDIKQGKNLIGAFWQPSMVIIDPNTLNTLSDSLFADGMGEVIKYGCIKSKELFEKLESCNIKNEIDDIIYQCVDIKRGVVERDEHEQGERALLNFGHTLGHAIEKLYNFTGISHGQAVAVGMALISKAGENQGITEKGTNERIIALCKKYALPASDKSTFKDMANAAKSDKKTSGNDISLVLLHKIGDSFTQKVRLDNLLEFITV